MEFPTLHLTRGTLAESLDQARAQHNAFSSNGPQPAIEIARSLGDLSHHAYTLAEGVDPALAAKPGELLYVDRWASPDTMEVFFANPAAQRAGDERFAEREEAEWSPAPGGPNYYLPAPGDTVPRFTVLTRATVASAADAVTALSELVLAGLPLARRRGQVSHALWVRHADVVAARPAANARRAGGERITEAVVPVEILLLDSWLALDGLPEHYADLASAGPARTTVWQQAPGFAEW
jgi:hypothetical protein